MHALETLSSEGRSYRIPERLRHHLEIKEEMTELAWMDADEEAAGTSGGPGSG